MESKGFANNVTTSGRQYNIGEKPSVILYTYINLHGGTPKPQSFLSKSSGLQCSSLVVVFFTLTDRASTIPSNIRCCQSGTWSQRGTKVNGSHHGDNPLLRPTGIQIATKSYATLQAMAPTNNKTVHQTSFTPYREQPRSTLIDCCRQPTTSVLSNKSEKYVPTSFDQQFQVSQGHTSYKNKEN